MSVKVLYTAGYRDSYSELRDKDFTSSNQRNAVWANSTITTSTPNGVLAGHIAQVVGQDTDGNAQVGIAGTTGAVSGATNAARNDFVGMFLLNAATDPFENQPALGSDKVAILVGRSLVEIDVYETHAANTPYGALTYAVGDELYVSSNGLLTNSSNASGLATSHPLTAGATAGAPNVAKPVGRVRKAPVAGSFTMTVDLFI